MEEEFNMKTAIFMESTFVYHLSLFHIFNKNFDSIFVINPFVIKCKKNVNIRKVKNDKKDTLSIANIGNFQDIKLSQSVSMNIFKLKYLVREYYKLTDNCSIYKKVIYWLRVIFPVYKNVFSNITSKSSRSILNNYSTQVAILNAIRCNN